MKKTTGHTRDGLRRLSEMQNEKLIELIDESIQLELNVSELYAVFSRTLPQDNEFWWQFHLEERSHAILLRTARDSFVKRGTFPEAILSDSLELVKQTNKQIVRHIEQCKLIPPTRRQACSIAIELEREAGERHYMQFMERHAETATESVFQQLNREDKAHEQRILKHFESLPAED